MKPWFRVYNDILTDEKLLTLSLDNQAIFIKLLAVTNLNNSGGSLPKLELISRQIGIRVDRVRAAIGRMVEAGLVDEDAEGQGFTIHGWGNRQYESDGSTGRSRRCREAKRNVADPVAETVAATALAGAIQTRAEQSRADQRNPPPTPKGGGEGRAGVEAPVARVVGPDGPVDVPSACSAGDLKRLGSLASAYFDPLCLTDQILRFVRVWSMVHGPDWIEALLAELAGLAAGGKRITEAFGTSILQRWAREGGIPEHRRKRPETCPPGDSGESVIPISRASPAASQRPLTEHQRNMAALRAFANAPLDGEASDGRHGTGLGFQGDEQARGAVGAARRAGAGE